MPGTERTQNFESIHLWQPNVQDDEIERTLQGSIQSGLTVMNHCWIMAGFGQCRGNLTRQSNIIFGNEDTHDENRPRF
jgi:hypothetical protein